jgi:hypothetical protein
VRVYKTPAVVAMAGDLLSLSCSVCSVFLLIGCPNCTGPTLSPTLCTSILIFTDTFAIAVGPSTRWLCFARGALRFFNEPERVHPEHFRMLIRDN